MSWIENTKIRKNCYVLLVNFVSTLLVFVVVSFLIRGYEHYFTLSNSIVVENKYDTNTIKATFPNYKDDTTEDALAIFNEEYAPGFNYSVFTGWRRNAYAGTAITVEPKFNTRVSVNHAENDSVWFFGGSTMWGTGSPDDKTIPSYYAQLTGEKVWNLGESAYNSFQELIQLEIFLSKGLKPKAVIFYDGVNDSDYCNANTKSIPTHSRVDQYSRYIKQFSEKVAEINELKLTIKELESGAGTNISILGKRIVHYLVEPYAAVYIKYFDNQSTGVVNNSDLSTKKKFSLFSKKKSYKVCGDSKQRSVDAAKTTVRTWLLAYDLLKSRNINTFFVLQPTAQIKPQRYDLDYLLDSKKQAIADETQSYESRYEQTKKIWGEYCVAHGACDNFLDLSDLFVGLDEPIFIDNCHVSPNGNKYVAERIVKFVDVN